MNTSEKSVMTSPLTDVRQAPLDRLRPADSAEVAVAVLNASL